MKHGSYCTLDPTVVLKVAQLTRESGAAHEVVDHLSVDREAGRAVGHQALALSAADLGTQVGLGRLAEDTGRLSEGKIEKEQ